MKFKKKHDFVTKYGHMAKYSYSGFILFFNLVFFFLKIDRLSTVHSSNI